MKIYDFYCLLKSVTHRIDPFCGFTCGNLPIFIFYIHIFVAILTLDMLGFSGNDDFYHGGPIYPNPKEPCLFLSLGRQVDVYLPLQKRSRFSVPFDISGEWFEQKQKPKTSIESLSYQQQ